jgi:hypothetical protein
MNVSITNSVSLFPMGSDTGAPLVDALVEEVWLTWVVAKHLETERSLNLN